jgi:hypothetical protein
VRLCLLIFGFRPFLWGDSPPARALGRSRSWSRP